MLNNRDSNARGEDAVLLLQGLYRTKLQESNFGRAKGTPRRGERQGWRESSMRYRSLQGCIYVVPEKVIQHPRLEN